MTDWEVKIMGKKVCFKKNQALKPILVNPKHKIKTSLNIVSNYPGRKKKKTLTSYVLKYTVE